MRSIKFYIFMYIKADSGNYVARLFYVSVWGQIRCVGAGTSVLRGAGTSVPIRGENWGLTWSELQVIYSM